MIKVKIILVFGNYFNFAFYFGSKGQLKGTAHVNKIRYMHSQSSKSIIFKIGFLRSS